MKTSLKWALLSALCVFYPLAVSAQKPPKQSLSPSLYVIYMLEQDDRQLGLLNIDNDELMTQITKTVEQELGYPMQLTYLTKSDFTQEALRRTIAGLKTQLTDIIIVYYAGFGIIQAQNTGNFANWKLHDTPIQGLSVRDVEKWLETKNVHLRLLIADCSAQLQPAKPYPKGSGQIVIREPFDIRKEVIQRLFLNNCGLVKLGSSLPLQNSVSSGSVFTQSLNKAFQSLLLTDTLADLPRISFQRLYTLTKNDMQLASSVSPFNQPPVLEIKSCQNAAQWATYDPLATETLNSLLNELISNPDSLQKSSIRKQLIDLSRADATVDVSRFFPSKDRSHLEEDLKLQKKYLLKDYLDQLQKPVSSTEFEMGKPQRTTMGWGILSILDKEVYKLATKPIKHLTIREEWLR